MSDDLKPLESEQEVASQSGGNQVNPIDVIMDAVSDEAKRNDVKHAIMLIREESYSGPIPSPSRSSRV